MPTLCPILVCLIIICSVWRTCQCCNTNLSLSYFENPIWKGPRKCRDLGCLENWHHWETTTFQWCSSENRHGIWTTWHTSDGKKRHGLETAWVCMEACTIPAGAIGFPYSMYFGIMKPCLAKDSGLLNFVSARGWRQICVRSHLFVESNLGSVQ